MAADLNKSIVEEEFVKLLNNISIKEAITDRHQEKYGLELTFQWGLIPIDEIFILSGLEIEVEGYFPISYVASDHRVL